eukprot:10932-Heterococcus_DN1.PRE.2
MDAEQLAAAAAKIQSVQRGRFVRSQKRKTSADAKTARAQREAAAVLAIEVRDDCSFVCMHAVTDFEVAHHVTGQCRAVSSTFSCGDQDTSTHSRYTIRLCWYQEGPAYARPQSTYAKALHDWVLSTSIGAQ